jgi:hypothetical protein
MTSALDQDFKRKYQAHLKHLRLKGLMLGFLRQPSLRAATFCYAVGFSSSVSVRRTGKSGFS